MTTKVQQKGAQRNLSKTQSQGVPVSTTWCVTFIPTASTFAPLVNTSSAASGSPNIWNQINQRDRQIEL